MSAAPSRLPAAGAAIVAMVACLALRPVLVLAGLDVETLIVNLYEQQAAPTWLVPWASGLVQWGPVPLVALLSFAATLRLARAFVPGLPNPLHAAAPRLRVALAALVLLPFLAASVPIAVAVATLVAVEALGWVEWLYNLNPTMEAIYVAVPVLLLPGAWLVATWGTARALGRRPAPPRPGVLALARRVAGAAAVGLALTAAAAVAVAAAPQGTRAARSHGAGAFKEHCGTCHFRTASLNFVKSPDEWSHTVTTMRGFAPSIDDDAASDALAFLTTVRSQSDAWVFRTRCGRCHGSTHAGWEHRTPEDWRGMVQRIARWSPVYYDAGTEDRVVAWLDEHRGDPSATLGLPAERWERYAEVARQCAPCHSMSWNADTYRQGDLSLARATVARMSQKMVEPLDDEAIDRIAADWKALLDDPAEFDRLFPHDRPEPEPSSTMEVEDRRPERGGNY